MAARRGMQVTRKPVKEDRQVCSPRKRKVKPFNRVKVTTLEPWDFVHVGRRWYTVRKIIMIGKKSSRDSICIVHTLEKGGMYFPSTSRVMRARNDREKVRWEKNIAREEKRRLKEKELSLT